MAIKKARKMKVRERGVSDFVMEHSGVFKIALLLIAFGGIFFFSY